MEPYVVHATFQRFPNNMHAVGKRGRFRCVHEDECGVLRSSRGARGAAAEVQKAQQQRCRRRSSNCMHAYDTGSNVGHLHVFCPLTGFTLIWTFCPLIGFTLIWTFCPLTGFTLIWTFCPCLASHPSGSSTLRCAINSFQTAMTDCAGSSGCGGWIRRAPITMPLLGRGT